MYNSTISNLSRVVTFAFVVTFFIALSGTATAGDREDAKALVGKWKEDTIILPVKFEFKGDGTTRGAWNGWTVKDGKLVLKEFELKTFSLKDAPYDFTLSPDETTLKFNGKTYKRQK